MSDVNKTLRDRDPRYGNFFVQARVSQGLKAVMSGTPNWDSMSDFQREALELIAIKISRILNGDPAYKDSWHDIAGYARLAEEQLEQGEKTRQIVEAKMRQADALALQSSMAGGSMPIGFPPRPASSDAVVLTDLDTGAQLRVPGAHVHEHRQYGVDTSTVPRAIPDNLLDE